MALVCLNIAVGFRQRDQLQNNLVIIYCRLTSLGRSRPKYQLCTTLLYHGPRYSTTIATNADGGASSVQKKLEKGLRWKKFQTSKGRIYRSVSGVWTGSLFSISISTHSWRRINEPITICVNSEFWGLFDHRWDFHFTFASVRSTLINSSHQMHILSSRSNLQDIVWYLDSERYFVFIVLLISA